MLKASARFDLGEAVPGQRRRHRRAGPRAQRPRQDRRRGFLWLRSQSTKMRPLRRCLLIVATKRSGLCAASACAKSLANGSVSSIVRLSRRAARRHARPCRRRPSARISGRAPSAPWRCRPPRALHLGERQPLVGVEIEHHAGRARRWRSIAAHPAVQLDGAELRRGVQAERRRRAPYRSRRRRRRG